MDSGIIVKDISIKYKDETINQINVFVADDVDLKSSYNFYCSAFLNLISHLYPRTTYLWILDSYQTEIKADELKNNGLLFKQNKSGLFGIVELTSILIEKNCDILGLITKYFPYDDQLQFRIVKYNRKSKLELSSYLNIAPDYCRKKCIELATSHNAILHFSAGKLFLQLFTCQKIKNQIKEYFRKNIEFINL